MKYYLLALASISLFGVAACSEKRPATEQELTIAKAWLACKQEKWDEVYSKVGTIGANFAVQKACGEEPPYVPDE